MTMTNQTLLLLVLIYLGHIVCKLKAQSAYCGGSPTYYTYTGVLQSPSYPNAYSSSCYCFYTISLSTISTILLTFETFELDRSSTSDYVRIICTSNSSFSHRYYYWNSVVSPISIPWCSSAQLYFQSDYYNQYPVRGFRTQFQVSTASCGSTAYTQTSGNITSPNYPQSYNSNDNCTYSIWASQPSLFTLDFQSFSLESSSGCLNDSVQIWCDDTGYKLPKYCGSTVPAPVSINNCNHVFLRFQTNEAIVFGGFSLQYFITPNGCGQSNYAGLSGMITSPNYPRSFAYTDCYYYVYPVGSITLTFLSLDLEPFVDNSYGDYVRVDCIGSGIYNGPFRGKTLPQPITFDSCSLVSVYFYSNNVSTGTGFSIRYQVNPIVAYGSITTKPLNTTVNVGSQVQLNCTSSITGYLPSWTMSRDGTDANTTVIASFCVVNSDYASQYSAVSGGPEGVCNLVITNATLAQAGVYTCIDVSLASFSSVVSVIDLSEVRNINIKGDTNGYIAYNGSLQCNVSSNSPASYQWLDHAFDNFTNGSTIYVTHSGTYTCNVYNVIRNKTYLSSKSITINVSPPTVANPDVGAIVLGSLFGICAIGYIALALYHVKQARVKSNARQPENRGVEDTRPANHYADSRPNAIRQPVYDNIPIPDLQSGSSNRTAVSEACLYEGLNNASHEPVVYDSLQQLHVST